MATMLVRLHSRGRPSSPFTTAIRLGWCTLAIVLTGWPCAAGDGGANCAVTSVGFVPLSEARPFLHKGFEGGLYPHQSNIRPPGHEAAGLQLAARVVPRDRNGSPDPVNGRIGVLAVGFSNTAREWDSFTRSGDPLRNPAVVLVNGAESGAVSELISSPTDPYWGRLLTRIQNAGLSPQQIQVIWYKNAISQPTGSFPQHARTLESYSISVMQTLARTFPNLAQCFVSSRIYAGYASTTLNPEPYAYESAFAYKWMLEKQIGGAPELNYDPQRGPVKAPWISWGPYLWADGRRARSDGLVWLCTDFRTDGTHPAAPGQRKVSNLLLAFFRTDPVTAPWYLASPPTGVESVPAATGWTVQPAYPNPFVAQLAIPVVVLSPDRIRAAVYSLDGRRVRTLYDAALDAGTHDLVWDGRDDGGARVAAGTYLVRIGSEAGTRTFKATLLR